MTIWTAVPDPRDDEATSRGLCEVVVDEKTWRHIAEKHVSSPTEPWDEWLTPALAADLRALWSGVATPDQRNNTVRLVAERVEREMRQSLGVPLALLFDNYQPPGEGRPSHGEETWLLVLPSGALLVVRSRPDGGRVCTCYFKDAASRAAPSVRWRATARNLLETYAKFVPERGFVPPDRTDTVEMKDELRARIRFRTNVTWCLDASRHRPWDAIPAEWKAPAPPGRAAITLRPRISSGSQT